GLSLILAASVVGFSAAITTEESLWTLRSVRWLTAILLCLAAVVVVTYYYALQVDNEGDDSGRVSALSLTVNSPLQLL
ncbi:MAG: hypothetical protein JO182_05355, partial [Acidobacteriaceae bacterium]|nr:hypothetical protein [Acidobacteriaceae bacterium]